MPLLLKSHPRQQLKRKHKNFNTTPWLLVVKQKYYERQAGHEEEQEITFLLKKYVALFCCVCACVFSSKTRYPRSERQITQRFSSEMYYLGVTALVSVPLHVLSDVIKIYVCLWDPGGLLTDSSAANQVQVAKGRCSMLDGAPGNAELHHYT